MKILKSLSGMVFTVAVMSIFGCGGGGSSTPPPPTTATLKLLSQGTTGTKIRGITVTVVLPPGVTVKATASTENPAIMVTDLGVVVPSGATSVTTFDPQVNPIGVYTPATALARATVAITLAGQSDFNLGEYVTVNTVIETGNFPKAADFTLTSFTAVDLGGNVISGASPLVTSSIVPDIR